MNRCVLIIMAKTANTRSEIEKTKQEAVDQIVGGNTVRGWMAIGRSCAMAYVIYQKEAYVKELKLSTRR